MNVLTPQINSLIPEVELGIMIMEVSVGKTTMLDRVIDILDYKTEIIEDSFERMLNNYVVIALRKAKDCILEGDCSYFQALIKKD